MTQARLIAAAAARREAQAVLNEARAEYIDAILCAVEREGFSQAEVARLVETSRAYVCEVIAKTRDE